jgi:hypothetical protein
MESRQIRLFYFDLFRIVQEEYHYERGEANTNNLPLSISLFVSVRGFEKVDDSNNVNAYIYDQLAGMEI